MENCGENRPRKCEIRRHRSGMDSLSVWNCIGDEGFGTIPDDYGQDDNTIDSLLEEADAKLYVWDGEAIFEVGLAIPEGFGEESEEEQEELLKIVISACIGIV